MNNHPMKASSKAKLRATLAKKKQEKRNLLNPSKNAVPPPTAQTEIGMQAASVDTNRLQERAYQRGLVTALECIIRELR